MTRPSISFPAPASSVAEVLALLRNRGDWRYSGEPLSHRQHALQCAALAHAAGAAPSLVAACLLHDIGHLLSDAPLQGPGSPGAVATPTLAGVDDRHEVTGPAWLAAVFPPAVLQPIRWHVAAKRCLAATEPAYLAALSEDSRRSLALQGGVMSAAEVAGFVARPWAADALRLRRWDEASKRPDAPSLPLEDLARLLEACERRG